MKGNETAYPPLSSAVVKNEYSCTYTRLCAFLANKEDNFTF